MPYCRSHVAYPRPGPRAAGGPRGTEREPGVRGASRPQFEPHATRSAFTTESELSWPLVSELKQPVYTITNLESILGTYSYKQRGKMCSHTTYTEECGPMQQMSWRACRHSSDCSDCPRMARTCRRRALSRSAWSDASSCADLAGYAALPARRCLGDGPRGEAARGEAARGEAARGEAARGEAARASRGDALRAGVPA